MKNNETITIATKQVAKFKSFNYWFIRSFDTNKTQNVFIIVDMITKEPVGKLVEDMYKHEYSVISDDEKCGLFEDDIKEDLEENVFQELNEKYFKIKECLFRCGNTTVDINSEQDVKDVFNSFINTRIYLK